MSLLTRTCDDVYIVTGPLYLPSKTPLGYMMQHPMIGDHNLIMVILCFRGSCDACISCAPSKWPLGCLLRSIIQFLTSVYNVCSLIPQLLPTHYECLSACCLVPWIKH